jgi:hypothetical protein
MANEPRNNLNEDNLIYFIKNLDNNKIEVIDQE